MHFVSGGGLYDILLVENSNNGVLCNEGIPCERVSSIVFNRIFSIMLFFHLADCRNSHTRLLVRNFSFVKIIR